MWSITSIYFLLVKFDHVSYPKEGDSNKQNAHCLPRITSFNLTLISIKRKWQRSYVNCGLEVLNSTLLLLNLSKPLLLCIILMGLIKRRLGKKGVKWKKEKWKKEQGGEKASWWHLLPLPCLSWCLIWERAAQWQRLATQNSHNESQSKVEIEIKLVPASSAAN